MNSLLQSGFQLVVDNTSYNVSIPTDVGCIDLRIFQRMVLFVSKCIAFPDSTWTSY